MAEEWGERVESWLAEAEQELARFENAVANHGLRVFERDANGERNVTDQARQRLQATIEEYRRLLRDE